MENIIKKRHTLISKQLADETFKILNLFSVSNVAKEIGKKLNLSPSTVHNYMYGRCSDGYTAEAILNELKKYIKK